MIIYENDYISFFALSILLIIEEFLKNIGESILTVSWYSFFTRMSENEVGSTFVTFLSSIEIIARLWTFTLAMILNNLLNVYVTIIVGYIYIVLYYFLVIN